MYCQRVNTKKNDYNRETTENCLDTFQIDPNETQLISNIPNITAGEVVSTVSGEGNKPVSFN